MSESAGMEARYRLSEIERDALGEIGNICMGTAATTLSMLLGKKVSITTPHVVLSNNIPELASSQKPYVAVEVSYTAGIDGYNILLVKNDDVLAITDLLMGGTGQVSPDEEIGELQLSAIGEVMNQMAGSSATSLADILKTPINIAPPRSKMILLEEDTLDELVCGHDTVIAIKFVMVIEDILDSEIMQIMPFQFGKQLSSSLLREVNGGGDAPEEPQAAPAVSPAPPVAEPVVAAPAAPIPAPVAQSPAPPAPAAPVAQSRAPAAPVSSVPAAPAASAAMAPAYPSFDEPAQSGAKLPGNLNRILDVPLQVTVELGQCRKSLKDVMGMVMGSVVVLNRMAGEMVDVTVNGKLFARGEVVVVDDSYGVRVTEITGENGSLRDMLQGVSVS